MGWWLSAQTPEKATTSRKYTACQSLLLHEHNSHPEWYSATRSLSNSPACACEMTIIIRTRQRAAERDAEPLTAHQLHAALRFDLKVQNSHRHPQAFIPSLTMGTDCCQACLCVCLQYKSVPAHLSEKQDVNAARRGRWGSFEPCLRFKRCVCMKSSGFNCADMCAWLIVRVCVWIYTSQGCGSLDKYELSLINNLKQRAGFTTLTPHCGNLLSPDASCAAWACAQVSLQPC